MIPEVLSQETKRRKRKVPKEEEKGKVKKRGRKAREESQTCQLCDFSCQTVKDMSDHSESEHPGETLKCPFPGCRFQRQNYMKVRIHQYTAKHFIIADHNQERVSQDAKKTFEFNSNENDEAGSEAIATEEKKTLDSFQKEEDSESRIEHDANKNDDEVKK